MTAHRALLVYPRFNQKSFWNYQETCKAVGARYSATPLGLITVAALLPKDWEVRLVDRNVESLEPGDLAWADLVMTGGMLPQQRDALQVIELAHAAGKPAVLGGPDVTASPEVYAAADFQIRGEAEELLGRFASEFEAGARTGVYVARDFPDVTRSPIPRFDLLKLQHYMHVGVQFSRGCPFDCEFCNVIELNGRKPRTKAVEQVCQELDALLATGYRGHVDFVDDNLIGNRGKAKPLLRGLAQWLKERRHPFEFTTEASLNLADDDELLELMRKANFFAVFVGVETPDPAALVETHKMQNTRRNIADSIRKIHRAGIFVNAGFIIGFDAERASMAEEMIACIEATQIPVCMVGLLFALPGTRLERRLKAEGRLHDGYQTVHEADADQCTSGLNYDTRRPRREMLTDYRTVLERIYAPEAYFGRARQVCRELDKTEHRLRAPLRHVLRDLRSFGRIAWQLGVRRQGTRRAFWGATFDTLVHNPRALKISGSFAALYLHLGPFSRMLVDRLEKQIAESPAEPVASVRRVHGPPPVTGAAVDTRTAAP